MKPEAAKPPSVLDLDENRPVVMPTAAATVIVVRAAQTTVSEPAMPTDTSEIAANTIEAGAIEAGAIEAGAIEIFFVKRHSKSAFMGGVLVFPGGKLDAMDAAEALVARTTGVHDRAAEFSDDPRHACALTICALRELAEEAGIVLTSPALDHDVALRWQADLNGDHDLVALAAALEPDTSLSTDSLHPFARWVTPTAEKRRFDARFYVAIAPAAQRGRHDAHETTEGLWASPATILRRYAEGEVFLAPPTIRALELLLEADSVEHATRIADRQPLQPICPEFVPDPPMLVLPGDPLHSQDEPRLTGGTRFVLDDGRFISQDAPDDPAADS